MLMKSWHGGLKFAPGKWELEEEAEREETSFSWYTWPKFPQGKCNCHQVPGAPELENSLAAPILKECPFS